MKKFKVYTSWLTCGTIEIEANDENEARMAIAHYDGFPEEQSYVDGSFEVGEIEEIKE